MLKIMCGKVTSRGLANKLQKQFFLASVRVSEQKRHNSFRTSENNPTNHSLANIGQFYKIPNDVKQKLFIYGGFPKLFEIQTKTFTESCLMIRKPAVDVINCIKNIDFTKPTVRFVLYGKKGCGKSLVLAHVVHYGYESGFLVLHIPWVGNWMRRTKEYSSSLTKDGFVDINLDAAAWLLHFKNQNSAILEKSDLITSSEYVWSKRETTPKGSHILQLIEHGINRVKYASECVIALSEEIKQLTTSGVCKTLVAIDGYNAFFYPETRLKTEKKEIVHPHKISVTKAFLNLTRYDWKNAVCVLTVDEIAIAEKDQISHLPRYLLGKDGFEHLDPFVPISVPDYTQKELTSLMDYYRERKWVQPLPGLDEELSFLSGNNPFKLMELCRPL